MVTYRRLAAARPAMWYAAADQWNALARDLESAADDLTSCTRQPLTSGGWISTAAIRAEETIDQTIAEIRDASIELCAVVTALRELAESVSAAQEALHEAEDFASSHGLTISATGLVGEPSSAATSTAVSGSTTSTSKQLQQMIELALSDATAADSAATAELGRLALLPNDVLAGAGCYYTNDTEIEIPQELREDYRPVDKLGFWDLTAQLKDQNLSDEMSLVDLALHGKGYGHAASLLAHWLRGTGSSVQINPASMMSDLADFNDSVHADIGSAMATAGSGSFDTGWRSASAAKDLAAGGSRTADWYYALNGYQYRTMGTWRTVDGHKVATVTVQVFKRYNWGNPTGGKPRNNLHAPGIVIKQNDLARLNKDGYAKDFNVWGTSTFQVSE